MKDYSIGLDIGTHSCGVAVIGSELKLYKYGGKNFWGAIKFDEGQTAKDRRLCRGARRLNIRRKQRIRNFRRLIEGEVLKVDRTFFHRLEDSFKHKEDKRDEYDFNLFIQKDFNDKDYFEKYPTIYHLRDKLANSKEKEDIRLIYLAIHHILKYRGNFLYEGQNFAQIESSISEVIRELFNECSEKLEVNINIHSNDIINILKDGNLNKKEKRDEIVSLSGTVKEVKDLVKEIFTGVVGLQMNLTKIFKDIDLTDMDKLKLSDGNIDEKLEGLSNTLGDSYLILELINKIYSWLQLDTILKGQDSLSKAMICKYDKFQEDLKILKDVIKKNCNKSIYKDIFRNDAEGEVTFNNYINNKIKVKDKSIESKRKAFYDKIKELIKDINSEESQYILNEIEEERFLIKLNTVENSSIPYQLHEMELKKILDNQGKYDPVIDENKDKIIKILTFRIPYYVGPLGKNGEFRWLVRNEGKENEKILPWNLEEVVDIDKSAEEFITRMTNFCSYLPDEKVLPFNSILYTEYLFYNEINKIRFNGDTLDSEYKELLKEEKFMEKNIVTQKDLILWYKNRFPNLKDNKNIEVSGFQGDKKANVTLKPLRDFTRIYGKITSENIKEIEKIIYYLTVFEDKKIAKRKIKKEFPHITEDKLKEIMKLKYSGWGRFSKKLLSGLKTEGFGGNRKSIIEILKETNSKDGNLNFMQIINSDDFRFSKKIEEINGSKKIEKINFDKHIKPLQGSPALKRGIWQSVKQIEEVIKLTGKLPQNIYIEFARSDEESKRTLPRKNTLIKLYENIEKQSKKEKELLKKLKDKSLKLDNERLYLYYIQQGKCMYSQDPLNIDELYNYEIDHIIPQSIIKDDSISNKVLVKTIKNQEKSGGRLPNEVINKNQAWWEILLKNNFISRKKYENLTNRSTGFGENVEKGFINRQLVEVRQISKHVTNILNRAYGHKGVKVFAIKAQLVDDFRKQFDIYKSREINDFHHAKDAYVVGVIGEYITKRFKNLENEFIYDEYKKYTKTTTSKDKFGFIISSIKRDFINKETGEIIWDAKENISAIKKILEYNDCKIVKKTEIIDGQMFNLTICKKPKSEEKITGKEIPLKNSKNLYLDPMKYGYYEGIQESYYSIIEFKKGKKRVKRLVGIPIMEAKKIGNSIYRLKEYIVSKGYEEVKILKAKVPKFQKIRYEGSEFYLVSSKEWCNAKQLKLPKNLYQFICSYNLNKDYDEKEETKHTEQLIEIYEILIDKLDKQYPIYQSIKNKIEKGKEKFIKLTSEEKVSVIKEILKITSANSQCGSLKLIGGTEREGRLGGKDNVDINKIEFIYESITGMKVSEVSY